MSEWAQSVQQSAFSIQQSAFGNRPFEGIGTQLLAFGFWLSAFGDRSVRHGVERDGLSAEC
jgi:hypothetical protein